MKETAILYTRVSTDEQNNGYSPADQKDKLYKYCQNNNIEVAAFFHDDESGKSFNRPEWLKIMAFIKKNKGRVNKLYFLKWDRFSRNISEAYITLKELKKLGVEAQSIEQPLNFEIPESKIMLSIYLAAPEVDNDRRALNILHGMRRGKKEGRWLGACPRGYKNARNENNRPVIVPEGGQKEELVKKAFTEFAKGLYNIEELRRMLNKEGLKCNRNSFWMLLRNRAYIGKVYVPAYKSEPAQWVEGSHKAIIDEQTFYEVQDILENRKKKLPNKYSTSREELPLRGYLICPKCQRNMTGSASKGKMGGKFFYYHCSNGCKERQRAKEMNTEFLNLLKSFTAKPEMLELGALILKRELKTGTAKSKLNLEQVSNQIEKNKQRLENAKILMLDGEIDPTEYKEMKIKLEEETNKLLAEENKLSQGNEDHGKKIDTCLELLQNIDRFFNAGDVTVKQRIVSSIFPEKLVFENKQYRTPRLNEAVLQIFRNGGLFKGNKKGKEVHFNNPSLGVVL